MTPPTLEGLLKWILTALAVSLATGARRMAAEKAGAVAARHPGSLVLAADTVVAAGRRILPKAEDDDVLFGGRGLFVFGRECTGPGHTRFSCGEMLAIWVRHATNVTHATRSIGSGPIGTHPQIRWTRPVSGCALGIFRRPLWGRSGCPADTHE